MKPDSDSPNAYIQEFLRVFVVELEQLQKRLAEHFFRVRKHAPIVPQQLEKPAQVGLVVLRVSHVHQPVDLFVRLEQDPQIADEGVEHLDALADFLFQLFSDRKNRALEGFWLDLGGLTLVLRKLLEDVLIQELQKCRFFQCKALLEGVIERNELLEGALALALQERQTEFGLLVRLT